MSLRASTSAPSLSSATMENNDYNNSSPGNVPSVSHPEQDSVLLPPPPVLPPRSRLRPPAKALGQQSSASELSRDKQMPESITSPQPTTIPVAKTKRQHALLELLSSERAYASDLALIREIHIPLSLGKPVSIVPSSLGIASPTPNINSNGEPPSSSFTTGSRSVSTASSTSTSSTNSHSNSNSTSDSSFTSASSSTPLPGSSIDLASTTPSSFVFDPSLGPPMTPEDTKIIFGNISELAVLADLLSDGLEEAMGDLLDGGSGSDHVGELFLRAIPDIEKPYTQYITRHPSALAHLHAISNPASPALSSYLSLTRLLSHSLTHAWDLQSLLIKPVQRLLKYSLLLQAVLDETPDAHPDKPNLLQAKTKIEDVARKVNEERRKAEVVRGVLGLEDDSFDPASGDGTMGSKKIKPSLMMGIGVNVLPPSVLLKTLRTTSAASSTSHLPSPVTSTPPPQLSSQHDSLETGGPASANLPQLASQGESESSEEALLIAQLHRQLQEIDAFAQQFAKDVMLWQARVKTSSEKLKLWALAFARVLGLTVPHHLTLDPSGLDNTSGPSSTSTTAESEAFNAFLALVSSHLIPLCSSTLHQTLTSLILTPLSMLLQTLKSPYKLISTMSSLASYHNYLLNMPLSPKNRPPPSLLSASKDYVALRSILARDLPRYVQLMQTGLSCIVKELVRIQRIFWTDLRNAWRGLWECLRVEGEAENLLDSGAGGFGGIGGGQGTVEVWYERWSEVAVMMGNELKCLRALPKERKSDRDRDRDRDREKEKERVRELERLRDLGIVAFIPYPSSKSPKNSLHHQRSHSMKRERSHTGSSSQPSPTHAVAVAGMLSALEPSHVPRSPPPAFATISSGSSGDKPRRGSNASSQRGRQLLEELGATERIMGRRSSSANHGYQGSLSEQEEEERFLPLEFGGRSGLHHSTSTGGASGGLRRNGSLKESPTYDRPSTSTSFSATGGVSPISPSGIASAFFSSGLPSTTKEEKARLKREEKERERAKKEAKEREKKEKRQKEKAELKKASGGGHFVGQDVMYLDMGPVLPPVSKQKKEKERMEEANASQRGSTRERLDSTSLTRKVSPGSRSSSVTTTSAPSKSSARITPTPSSPTLYTCRVIVPCAPVPHGSQEPGTSTVMYQSIPFFTLAVGDLLDVLEEAGHPSAHPELPLWVDEGEDCLLLCKRARWTEFRGDGRDDDNQVGWALASFLEPVS